MELVLFNTPRRKTTIPAIVIQRQGGFFGFLYGTHGRNRFWSKCLHTEYGCIRVPRVTPRAEAGFRGGLRSEYFEIPSVSLCLRGESSLFASESESEAQGYNARALILPGSRIHRIIRPKRPDWQIIPHATPDAGRKVIEWRIACTARVHEGRSRQIAPNRDDVFSIEDRSGEPADWVILSVLWAEFCLIKTANGR